MTDRISRRAILGAAAFIIPAALARTVPLDPFDPLFKRSSARAATPASVGTAVSTVRSYGPNGTHWPANTPQLGSTFGKVVDVACDWTAIGKAIAAVTDAEIDKGVHIRVAPGTLPGFGASSGSQAAIKGIGRGTATKNILVSPKNGWGTVTIADSVRLVGVKGVTFARINGRFILLTDCSRTSWAQSKVGFGFRMTSSNGVTSECNAYEVVMADAKIDINDPFGYAAGTGSMITQSVWEGCYCAPVFRPSGATDHIDTLQMYGNGAYRGLTDPGLDVLRRAQQRAAARRAEVAGPRPRHPVRDPRPLDLHRPDRRHARALPGAGRRLHADHRPGAERQRRARAALRQGLLRVRVAATTPSGAAS